jgi:hypothetical protein
MIVALLRCMSPLMAQFGRSAMSAIWSLSGAKRTLSKPHPRCSFMSTRLITRAWRQQCANAGILGLAAGLIARSMARAVQRDRQQQRTASGRISSARSAKPDHRPGFHPQDGPGTDPRR